VALAALGGGVLVAAFGVSIATGDGSEAGWILVGPMPFCALGLIGYLRRPCHRVVWWLLGVGIAFGCDVALGDVFLPMAERHWGAASLVTVTIALLGQWVAAGTAVASVGLFGLFPSGRPERGYERVAIWTVVLVGFLLPLLNAVTSANIVIAEMPADGTEPIVRSPLSVPTLAPLPERSQRCITPSRSGLRSEWSCSRCATGTPVRASAGRSAGYCSA
jgi:hypothetical protein